MSELSLSLEDFVRRYIDPVIEHTAAMVRRELRRRRISRRTFLQMSEAERFVLTQAAIQRYGHDHDVPNR